VVDGGAEAGRGDGEGDGNHTGGDAEFAADGGGAVLGEGADGAAGVDDFEGVEGRGEGGDDLCGGHGEGDGPGLKDGMTAGEQLRGVDVGDGAGGGDFKVSADQLQADGRAGEQRGVVRGVGCLAHGTAGGDGFKAGAGHAVFPNTDGFRRKAAHEQWGFHGLKSHLAGGVGDGGLGQGLAGGGHVTDFQHVGDGSDASDGLFAELSDAVGECAEQAALDVDRATAHAGDDAGEFGFLAVETGEDHVFAGAACPTEDTEDFDIHGFGDGALKDGPGYAAESAMDLGQGEDADRGGRRSGEGGLGRKSRLCARGRGRWCLCQGRGSQAEDEGSGENLFAGCFLHGDWHVYQIRRLRPCAVKVCVYGGVPGGLGDSIWQSVGPNAAGAPYAVCTRGGHVAHAFDGFWQY